MSYGTLRQNGLIVQPVLKLAVFNNGVTVNNTTISGGGEVVTKTASQALGGHRVLYSVDDTHVDYADNTQVSQIASVLGVSENAAISGADILVRTAGEITESGWSWTPGHFVYVGTNGGLTQTPPTTGFCLVIGTALAPTVLQIKIGAPIQLT